MRGAVQIMVSVAEKKQRPDIPAEPEKLPGGTFGGWDSYVELIQRCWAGELGERPSFEAIINVLRELLTAAASQTRQRRMTDHPSGTEGIGSPSGLPKLAEDSTSPGESHEGPTSVVLVDLNICCGISPPDLPSSPHLGSPTVQLHHANLHSDIHISVPWPCSARSRYSAPKRSVYQKHLTGLMQIQASSGRKACKEHVERGWTENATTGS